MSEGDPKAVPALPSSSVGDAASPIGEELAGLTSSRWFPSLRQSAGLGAGALSSRRFTSCRQASAPASLVPTAVVCAITAHITPSATVNLPSAPTNLASALLFFAPAAVGKPSAPVTLLSATAVDGSPTAADGWFGSADAKLTGARTKFPSAHGKFSSSAGSPAAASQSTPVEEARLLTSVAFLPHPGPLPLGVGTTLPPSLTQKRHFRPHRSRPFAFAQRQRVGVRQKA